MAIAYTFKFYLPSSVTLHEVDIFKDCPPAATNLLAAVLVDSSRASLYKVVYIIPLVLVPETPVQGLVSDIWIFGLRHTINLSTHWAFRYAAEPSPGTPQGEIL